MNETIEKYLNSLAKLNRINAYERPLYEDEKHQMHLLIKKLALYYTIEDDPTIKQFLDLLICLF